VKHSLKISREKDFGEKKEKIAETKKTFHLDQTREPSTISSFKNS
jgi:hypothetical protein